MSNAEGKQQVFNAKNISNIFSIIRKNKGITQLELGNKLGWDRSRIAKIEANCQRMYLHDFLDLCSGLSVCPLDVIKASLNINEVPEFEKLLTKEEKKKQAKIQKLEREIQRLKGAEK